MSLSVNTNAVLKQEVIDVQTNNRSEVLKGVSIKEQKWLAPSHHSVLREPLVSVDFSRVFIAVLHIVLGVVKKMFDELILDLQTVDNSQNVERNKLLLVRDKLGGYYEEAAKMAEDNRNEHKRIIEQKSKAYSAYKTASHMAKNNINGGATHESKERIEALKADPSITSVWKTK